MSINNNLNENGQIPSQNQQQQSLAKQNLNVYDDRVWQTLEQAIVQKYMSLIVRQYDFSEVLVEALDAAFKEMGAFISELAAIHNLSLLFYYTKVRLYMERRNFSKEDPRLKQH